MLTAATNASPSAAGRTSRTSDGCQVKPANGGNDIVMTPSGFSRQPSSEAVATASTTPSSGAGERGHRRAAAAAPATTIVPSSSGSQRA